MKSDACSSTNAIIKHPAHLAKVKLSKSSCPNCTAKWFSVSKNRFSEFDVQSLSSQAPFGLSNNAIYTNQTSSSLHINTTRTQYHNSLEAGALLTCPTCGATGLVVGQSGDRAVKPDLMSADSLGPARLGMEERIWNTGTTRGDAESATGTVKRTKVACVDTRGRRRFTLLAGKRARPETKKVFGHRE